MGWIRGELNGGSGYTSPYVIFENGKWQNSNLFDVTISPTGGEYISIVNGELVYGNGTTGITFYSKTGIAFVAVVSFYTSSNGMYMQTGRCVRGADARVVQSTGTDRYSYHNWNPSYELPYAVALERVDASYAQSQAIFFSGNNYTIKSIYAYDVQNSYCINSWVN